MIVFAVILGLITLAAFFGNLLVLLVVKIYESFHYIRYFLLASLALSDLLFTVMITSNRSVCVGLERWIFGTTWCHIAAYFARSLYLSTVFHLCLVSYERYWAIFKDPFNYTGRLTKKRTFLGVMFLWVAPMVLSVGPFIGWGGFVYTDRPEIFACETKWDKETLFPFSAISFLVPFGLIFFLNYKILSVVRRIKYSVKVFPLRCDVDGMFQNKENGTEQNEPSQDQRVRQQEDKRKTKTMPSSEHDETSVLDDVKNFMANYLSKMKTQLHTSLEGHPTRQNQNHTSVDGNDFPKGAICLTRNKDEGGNDFCHNHKSNNLYSRGEKKVNRIRECKISNTNYRLEEISHGPVSTTRSRQFHKEMREDSMSSITRGERHHIQSDGAKSENIVSHPPDNKFTLPSLERPPSKRHTLGKTQMRIAKLLKEGKAAIDAMIIIGVFILCFFPFWIINFYRTFEVLPVEAVLTAHCLYASTMAWNPVVYSIRKREFREGVRKLFKLSTA